VHKLQHIKSSVGAGAGLRTGEGNKQSGNTHGEKGAGLSTGVGKKQSGNTHGEKGRGLVQV